MYSKVTCRNMLLRMKSYVKLSNLAVEFGIPKAKLSAFLNNDSYMREISEERINEFVNYCQSKILEIVT